MLEHIITTTLFMTALLASETSAIAESNDNCKPLQGWEAVRDKSENGFLIFGELHGTEQSPSAFAEYVCAISKPNEDETGDSVLIAVEFNSNDDALFRKTWEASEKNFVKEMTDSISDWKWRQDGVASQAMLSALKRLHMLKSRGHNIDITAFNGTKNDEQREKFKHLKGSGPHEAAQAENIRNAAQKDHYDHVVILVGNLHAEKNSADFGLGEYSLMAMKLAETEKVISLQQLYLDGSSWSCFSHNIETKKVTPKDIICKEYSSRANVQNISGNPRMALSSEGDAEYHPSYDGYYFVGNINASKPAGYKSK